MATKIEEEADGKSSLNLMSRLMKPDAVADVWEASRETIIETTKAQFKARILTGSYRLQAVAKRQNQHEIDGKCNLCRLEDEDRRHFVVTCPALENIRQTLGTKIADFLQRHNLEPVNYRETC